ncbi:amino acid ABC transporter substrate-binding protein [Lentilactobacillus senioris]|uniref:amino acid ABC transporter substrate-binding protein n=1 Tax=Lentilactobacillus senioris TaxID=931534 RepID=UPI002282822D|nr:amino acid ABC transporter substrate-binding protein [Lentilactobacillus senioris]MCY9807306.1 amino acid ABC transporter substrate-binding protein [Lentilactobacillus senioris]
MKKIFRYWLGLLVISMLVVLGGCAKLSRSANQVDNGQAEWNNIQRRGTVVIGLDDSFVPMGFQQRNGTISGYDVDLAKAVFKQYNLKVDFQSIDWSMNVTELRNGTIDLIWNGFSINNQRKKVLMFSEPYLQNKQVLVTKTNSKINTLKQMNEKVLGLQSGSAGALDFDKYPQLLKNQVKDQDSVQYDSFTNAFLDLNAGRIQGLLIDSVYANYYINHQKDKSSYKVIDTNYPMEYYGVGIKKGNTVLQQKINQGLNRLAKSGELAKINHKWFGNTASSPLITTTDGKINAK